MIYVCVHLFTVADCGFLVAPVFGEVNLTDTTFGSVAGYSCGRGYSINGTTMRVCEGSGKWSGTMPLCIRKIVVPTMLILFR